MTREPERFRPRPASTVRAALIGAPFWAFATAAGAVVCSAPSFDDVPLPATKFAMATRDCVLPAVLETAAPLSPIVNDTRHEAEQLALYRNETFGVPVTLAAPLQAPIVQRPTSPPRPTATSRSVSSDHARRVRAVAPALARAARDFGIDPWLLHAVAHVESRHNPVAQSHAGARGLMQVMPATAKRFGVQQPHHELLDFETNVRVSAEYLKVLQGRFGNNLPLVLAAYNAGEGAVEKYGRKIPPYRETQAYVRSVIDTYLQLRSAAQHALPQASRSVTP